MSALLQGLSVFIIFLCYPDKTEKPVSVNIKLRLMEHGEVEEGMVTSPSLELVMEKEEEEEKLGGKQSQQQDCTQISQDDRTSTCSADSP